MSTAQPSLVALFRALGAGPAQGVDTPDFSLVAEALRGAAPGLSSEVLANLESLHALWLDSSRLHEAEVAERARCQETLRWARGLRVEAETVARDNSRVGVIGAAISVAAVIAGQLTGSALSVIPFGIGLYFSFPAIIGESGCLLGSVLVAISRRVFASQTRKVVACRCSMRKVASRYSTAISSLLDPGCRGAIPGAGAACPQPIFGVSQYES